MEEQDFSSPNERMWVNATLSVLIAELEVLKATHMSDRNVNSTSTTAGDLMFFYKTVFPGVIARCTPLDRVFNSIK